MNLGLYGAIAVVSYAALFPMTRWLRFLGVIDVPNARSSHTAAVVRGGGVIMVLVVTLVVATNADAGLRGVGTPLITLAAVSFWDDLRSLAAGWRLVVQVGVAGLTLLTLGFCQQASGTLGAISIVILLVWIVGYTNAFNFMDGINGLAAGQAVLTGVGTALLAHNAGMGYDHPAVILALTVSATAVGFFPHNFPRPRVFMGDVGSASLGFLLAVAAALAIRDGGWWCALYLGVLHGNFVLDTTVTLLRRAARGERWYSAHREHFYQRLTRAGWSHAKVTTCEMGIQAVNILVLSLTVRSTSVAKVAVALGVLSTWTVFFALADRHFERSRGLV
jgi:UDP-N-acetylmuramyl pentapeptide phosphotransferase/UDP-N-acetylglucosamine-1-phosphate transferase